MDNEKAPAEQLQHQEHAQASTEATTAPYQSSNDTAVATKARSPWPMRLGLLLVTLLAIAALAASFWLDQQIQQQQLQNQQLQQQIVQAQNAPTQQLQQLNQALQTQQQQLGDTQNTLQKMQQTEEQLGTKVAALAQRHPNHWLAAEAEYLVRLAGRKLWLEKDPQTAVGLLKAADERIAAMQESSLVPLRRAIAEDITAVSEIKNADIAGTVYALDGVIAKLEKMPLNRLQQQDEPEADDQQVTTSLSDWRTNLAKTWRALKDDFFTIRKVSTDVTPLLSGKQEWYLEENIRNKLLQAQLALYQYNELNYRQSITLARKWIQQYYDLEDSSTQEVLASLEALASLKLDAITVQQFNSSKQLKQLVTYGNLLPNEEVAP
ncbi:uroporphyrinogen-III C-methyltransferase [Shewanella sp. A3A]|nr:uroporphyrinogen-III C-methyltransferase [Shewanella ferrihydritica]